MVTAQDGDPPAGPAPMGSGGRRRDTRLLLIFMASGAAGLIYQVVWIRLLSQSIGSSTEAIATVVAGFMAGFAVGGLTLGQIAHRLRAPLVAYARMEQLVALGGLLLTLVLPHLAVASVWLVHTAGEGHAALTVGRVVLVTGLLLLPTALMGGTLPVLTRHLTLRGVPPGRPIALLYAANTAGAVLGCLLPDFVLIPATGLRGAALVAVAVNLLAAWAALALHRHQVESGAAVEPVPREAASPAIPARREARTALAVITLSGAVALGFEVVWSRLNVLFAGSQVFAFSVLLAVYLTGIALGSALISRVVDRVRNRLALLGHLELAIGVATLLTIWVLPELDSLRDRCAEGLVRVLGPPTATTGKFALAMVVNLVSASVMVLLPTVLLGATVPVAARIVADGGAPPGAAVGRVYFWNTMAGIAGALGGGLVLLPVLGSQWTLALLGGLGLLLGLAALVVAHRGSRRRLVLPVVVALGAGVAVATLLPPGYVMQRIFQRRYGQVKDLKEGAHQTFILVEQEFVGTPVSEQLYTDSYSMTGRNAYCSRYMKMMAHLPVLTAREPRTACLICFGLGTTLEGLVSRPELERIDVVDISPEVFDLYREVVGGEGALQDPRVHLHVDDGRHFLLTTSRQYDVITLEPPPPASAGVVNLYSTEFYEVARQRLTEGGALCQWLPLAQITPQEGRSMIAAFVEVFPAASLWHGVMLETILLGANGPQRLDPDQLRQRMEVQPAQEDLQRIGLRKLPDLLGVLLMGPEELARCTVGFPAVTDDRPILPHSLRYWDERGLDPVLFGTDADLDAVLQAPDPGQEAARNQLRAEVLRTREKWQQVYPRMLYSQVEGSPAAVLARTDELFGDLVARYGDDPALLLYAGIEIRRTRAAVRALQADPFQFGALVYMGRIELLLGDPARARTTFERALQIDSSQPAALHFLIARAYEKEGSVGLARGFYQQALAEDLDPVFQRLVNGMLERLGTR